MRDEHATKLLEAARDLAPTIAGRGDDIERERRVPPDLLAQLKAAGLFRMFVPRSHGGLELDLRAGLDIFETLARADASTAWAVMIGAESPQVLALLPRARFDAIYGASPDVVLAGGSNVQGEAHVVDGGYRVTGKWAFASGCEHADWWIGNCVVMQDGQPRPGAAPGTPELRGMIWPAAAGRVVDTWRVLGMRGSGSHDIAVEDQFVPDSDSLDLFLGTPSIAGPNFVAPVLHIIAHMAAVAVGIAQGALDEVTALARDGKKRLFARASLAESQAFQIHLGRAEMDVTAARALVRTVGEEFWAACAGDPAAVPAILPRLSAMLAWVAETSARVVDGCYRAGGGGAARDASPLQRRFRDMHTLTQHAAAAEGFLAQAGALRLGQPTGFFS
ncbi:acyl-CoA dehydrogenase family protein [Nannocystis radixulma]|uniref:Acyl-CoA dehydrogenase family protein n=1 Tax=Nannocystis radixulma TaxID=2995305 RepID=A0ABT5BJL5_9BACT|nr:acyl-CoA dehydrogenase family protein [Nannocystis radixulma]MDC0673598.1 acyl-CoA dehydrogenase family protein [Nannocystis radixulma]